MVVSPALSLSVKPPKVLLWQLSFTDIRLLCESSCREFSKLQKSIQEFLILWLKNHKYFKYLSHKVNSYR